MQPTSLQEIQIMRVQNNPVDPTKVRRGNLMGAPKASPEKIDQIASEFEAQFISQMLGNMFSTVDAGGYLGGGQEEEFYRSMLVDEYGKIIARTGGIGVSDHVKREMLRMQEV